MEYIDVSKFKKLTARLKPGRPCGLRSASALEVCHRERVSTRERERERERVERVILIYLFTNRK
jgi:hypothetical protein